jgi:hypothetical protein
MPDQLSQTRPWRKVEAPAEVLAVPTMLSKQELGLLYWLARDYWSGKGRIIDGGSFLGGSTVALAAGVRDRATPVQGQRIVVYDRFKVEQYAVQGGYFDSEPGLRTGESFRFLFDRNIAAFSELLDVREGNITRQVWADGPIEIQFLDVLKSWRINDWAVREFWPSLIPGHSIVVQQDYQYGLDPWLAVTMERLHKHFERLDEMPWATVVFRLKSPLPDLLAMTPSRDLPPREKLALMGRAINRETTQQGEWMLRLQRVLLNHHLGRHRAARAELAAVRTAAGGNGSVMAAADQLVPALRVWGVHRETLYQRAIAPLRRLARAVGPRPVTR